ncbi:hypothetical protein T484DRAFT_1807259 [Baffinella frigidus]|nr:hypothetical protein T484DRAFT_1807259 [Cryptophyta sp. CCMP2293]
MGPMGNVDGLLSGQPTIVSDVPLPPEYTTCFLLPGQPTIVSDVPLPPGYAVPGMLPDAYLPPTRYAQGSLDPNS